MEKITSENMARIKPLASEVIDQIAAGEVVERPSNLVKELLENSLDAGATEISLEIADGGRSLILIDNGSGIHPEDMSVVLLRHSTSKIQSAEDLWRLGTYGFRGEALASIAAVSDLSLSSRKEGAKEGSQVRSQFGKLSKPLGVGHAKGTKVVVNQLFENVPARLKFLRSATAEVSAIKMVIRAMALAHPQVSWKVFENKNLTEFYPATDSFAERVGKILKIKDVFEGSIQSDSWQVRSFFSSPQEVNKTSRQIWIFVQNRWVQDKSLQTAVMEAYRNLLMHGEFPSAAVFISMDPALVDVNIHPTKTRVKFQSPDTAFRLVCQSIRASLEKSPWLKNQGPQYVAPSDKKSQPEIEESSSSGEVKFGESYRLKDAAFEQVSWRQKSFHSAATPSAMSTKNSMAVQSESPLTATLSQRDSTGAANFEVEAELTPTTTKYWSRLKYQCQVHLTYLICEAESGLILVDQHAAHERVLFEKLMESFRGKTVERQDLLLPLMMDLPPEQVEALLQASDQVLKFGVEIEQMGPNTLAIKSLPSWIKESALVTALSEMAQSLVDHGGSFAIEKKISDVVATMACHSAIRAGQSLSEEEVFALLKSMDDYPLTSFCPHGRPVSIEIPFSKIERDFGRIP